MVSRPGPGSRTVHGGAAPPAPGPRGPAWWGGRRRRAPCSEGHGHGAFIKLAAGVFGVACALTALRRVTLAFRILVSAQALVMMFTLVAVIY